MSEIDNYKKVKFEKTRFYNFVQSIRSSDDVPYQVNSEHSYELYRLTKLRSHRFCL